MSGSSLVKDQKSKETEKKIKYCDIHIHKIYETDDNDYFFSDQ
jgi:hypothetical protein